MDVRRHVVAIEDVFGARRLEVELFCPNPIAVETKEITYSLNANGRWSVLDFEFNPVEVSGFFPTSRYIKVLVRDVFQYYRIEKLERTNGMFVKFSFVRVNVRGGCCKWFRPRGAEREEFYQEVVYQTEPVSTRSGLVHVLYHREDDGEFVSFVRDASKLSTSVPVDTMRELANQMDKKSGIIPISAISHVCKLRPHTDLHDRLRDVMAREPSLLGSVAITMMCNLNPVFAIPMMSRVKELPGDYTINSTLDKTVWMFPVDIGVSKLVKTQNKASVVDAIAERLTKPRAAAEERMLTDDTGAFVIDGKDYNLFEMHSEFLGLVANEIGKDCAFGDLVINDFKEEDAARVRPAQRRGLEATRYIGLENCGDCGHCRKVGFLKSEVGGLDSSARLVYTVNQTESVNQGCVFSALAKCLKKSKHYAFVGPDLLVERLHALMGLKVLEGDFAKFDATRLEIIKLLIDQLISYAFAGDQVEFALGLHDINYYWTVLFKTRKGGAKAETSTTLPTGVSQTSVTNTWLAMFYIFAMYRINGDTAREAYNRCYVVGGDDSVCEYVPGLQPEKVGCVFGFKVKPIVREAGAPFSFFANWYNFVGPDTFVFPDFLRKFNSLLVSHVRSAPPEQVALRKANSFLMTYGGDIPVLSALCKWYTRRTDLTTLSDEQERQLYSYELMTTGANKTQWFEGCDTMFNKTSTSEEHWWSILSTVITIPDINTYRQLLEFERALDCDATVSELERFSMMLEPLVAAFDFVPGERFVDLEGKETVVKSPVASADEEEKTDFTLGPEPMSGSASVTLSTDLNVESPMADMIVSTVKKIQSAEEQKLNKKVKYGKKERAKFKEGRQESKLAV